MKIILTITILMFALALNAQPQWVIYTPNNSGLPDSFVGSILIDSNNVKWITTSNGFVRMKGNSWTVYDTLNSGIPQNTCCAVTKDKQNNLWLCTSNKGIAKFDGLNWTIYNNENTGFPINQSRSIVFDNNNTKWIGGGGGVYKFNDTSWVRYYPGNSGQPSNLVANLFYHNNILWVATSDKGIVKFDGQNWTVYDYYNSQLPSNWTYMIKSDNYNNIWIATFFGGVAKFNYGQNLWTIYNTGNSGLHDNNTFSIYVDNNNVKWIGAAGCAVFNDTNWQIFPYEFIGDVSNFSKDKYGNMWICAAGGLYVYNPNGVVGVEDNSTIIPKNLLSLQNYPNPFNPKTIIRFGVPSLEGYAQRGVGMVTLKVFDITGREIQTLVNEKLQPGTYEVTFDGSNLPSGVYFYKLTTDNFMMTKRMLYLK